MRTTLLTGAVILLIAQGEALVWAQTRTTGSTTQSGMFGSRTVGGTGMSSGQRTLGGNSGMGAGGMGGMSGQMGSSSSSNYTNVGQVQSSDRFLRNNRGTGQFVGANTQARDFVGALQAGASSGMGSMRSQSGMSSMGMGNMLGMSMNRRQGGQGGFGSGGFGQGGNMGRGRSTNTEMPVTLHVGFNHTSTSPQQVSTTLAQRVARSSGRIQNLSPLEILVEGGTATLRGVVATDHDRELIEQLARLEAGIWQVNNELVVGQPTQRAQAPAATGSSTGSVSGAAAAAKTPAKAVVPLGSVPSARAPAGAAVPSS